MVDARGPVHPDHGVTLTAGAGRSNFAKRGARRPSERHYLSSERLGGRVNGSGNPSTPTGRFADWAWMFARLYPTALVVHLLLAVAVRAAESRYEVRLMQGDDPRWADPAFDDSNWPVIESDEYPARSGPYWVRIHLEFDGDVPPSVDYRGRYPLVAGPGAVDSIFLSTTYSWELYWDGRLLARSGRVGDSAATEIAGSLDHLVRLPADHLGPGRHVVAMRISSHHYNFAADRFFTGLRFVNHDARARMEARAVLFPVAGAAGAALMGVVSILLYLALERRRALVLCAALCATLTVFYLFIALRWLTDHPYHLHAPRLAAIAGLNGLCGILLPWLLLEWFGFRRKWVWFAVLVPLLAAGWHADLFFENRALWMTRATLLVSLSIAVVAAVRRQAGAWAAVAGMAAGLLVMRSTGRVFLDPTYFLVLGGIVLLVFATLGWQMQAERRRIQQTRLTAARLEIELLRRHLQPHFLMNTLTTLMEVIEQEPKTAVTLIEALAGECRILVRVSGEKLIPLAEELELCRAHLRIMSLRKGVRAELDADGVDEHASVPPALFHTLVENGLTHLRPQDGRLQFVLCEERPGGVLRYRFRVEGEASEKPGAASREGTGLRYIKARLEESFPGRWRLESHPVDAGWETVIELRAMEGRT